MFWSSEKRNEIRATQHRAPELGQTDWLGTDMHKGADISTSANLALRTSQDGRSLSFTAFIENVHFAHYNHESLCLVILLIKELEGM